MDVEIIKFDSFGRGIGRINNKIIFVDKALPNEKVDVLITKEKTHYLEGKIINIKKKSSTRIKPICPFYDKCGGCDFLHTTYDNEKEFKLNKGKELLGRIDGFYETQEMNYRNKATFHIKDNKIGFYREQTNDIVSIDYCYLLDDKINKVLGALKHINMQNYHIKKIIIRISRYQILLWIDGLVDNLFVNYFNDVDTIIMNNKVLKGKGYIEEIIDRKTFRITGEAFFQVNNEGLNNINNIIKEFLINKEIGECLDLYSGTSLWGILVSSYCKHVTSIEINEEACRNARENVSKNNINNLDIINGSVEQYIEEFKKIDLVILDPPRNGLDKKTRKYMKTISSKYIIYISCDMQTLKRDLEDLCDTYKVISINLVDMFKRTYHCESLVILERK